MAEVCMQVGGRPKGCAPEGPVTAHTCPAAAGLQTHSQCLPFLRCATRPLHKTSHG